MPDLLRHSFHEKGLLWAYDGAFTGKITRADTETDRQLFMLTFIH